LQDILIPLVIHSELSNAFFCVTVQKLASKVLKKMLHIYIICLLSFLVENLDKFKRNTDVHNLNTRRKHDLYMPNTNLTKYQKGVYYTGIKLFNNLPPAIKSLNYDIKVFKPALKDYLFTHSFYSVDDFISAENF
jgi:hypothetical protein